MKTLLLITLLSITLLSTNTQAADEGIKVHGHWKLEIYNPDGSFDRTIEFENSLYTSEGSGVITGLLSRQTAIHKWTIQLGSNAATGMPCDLGNSDCQIVEPGENPMSNSNTFDNLQVSVSTSSSSSKILTLSGSFVAGQTTSIERVDTLVSLCFSQDTTNCSTTNFDSFFTGKVLSNVNVNLGQIVQVTVEISFS